MEVLSRYLLAAGKFDKQIFVSNPPNAALLIWTNKKYLPGITDVSIVESSAKSENSGVTAERLKTILEKQLFDTLPIAGVVYKQDLSSMNINGDDLTLDKAAQKLSELFRIDIGGNPAKAPNDAAQISDSFHLWSRDAFDGRTVMKTDIDLLRIEDERIKSIIEIKRSRKVPVGKWKPYIDAGSANNDVNNYYMLMSFAGALQSSMITIHHEEMDNDATLTGEETADFFVYKPESAPNRNVLDAFADASNRRIRKIGEVFGIR